MKSNNKIQAIIYLILVVILCASLVGVISNISKRAEELFGGGNDKQNSTSTTAKPTTTKPVETTKPTETMKPAETTKPVETTKPTETTKPAETTKPVETCKHTNVSSKVVLEATCTKVGKKEFYCVDCGVKQREETIPIVSHKYDGCVCAVCGADKHVAKSDITYVPSGNNTHYERVVCSVCNGVISYHNKTCTISSGECSKCGQNCSHINQSLSSGTWVSNGNGTHTFKPLCTDCLIYTDVNSVTNSCTYNTEGECETCGYVKAEEPEEPEPEEPEEPDVHVHNYTSEITKSPTCSDNSGERTYTCENCGDSYKETFQGEVRHREGSFVVTVEATCETEGIQVASCVDCGASLRTQTISALGHNMVDNHCTRCDYEFHIHNQGNSAVVLEPTCTTTGKKEWYCTICGSKQYEETIPALGHSYTETFVSCGDGTHDVNNDCSICGDGEVVGWNISCSGENGICDFCGGTITN